MAISEYLRELRQLVGTRLLLVPGVTVLVWSPAGELLLVRSVHTGMWQTLGGAVDPGESPRQAAVRETREEAGVEVQLDGLRDVVGGPGYEVRYPNGDRVGYVGSVFDAHIVSGEPRPDGDGDEVTATGWFQPGRLGELELEPLSRRLLRQVGVLDG